MTPDPNHVNAIEVIRRRPRAHLAAPDGSISDEREAQLNRAQRRKLRKFRQKKAADEARWFDEARLIPERVSEAEHLGLDVFEEPDDTRPLVE